MRIVNLDVPATWPDALRAFVDRTCQTLSDTDDEPPRSATDLREFGADDEIEAEFRKSVDGHFISCFHATRLLPHEPDDIRSRGLRILTDDLRRDKVTAAAQRYPGLVNEQVARELLAGGQHDGPGMERNGLLWFFTPIGVAQDPRSVGNLLANWGGETLGWTDAAVSERIETVLAELAHLSEPTLVEVGVDLALTALWRTMWRIPVAVALGLDDPSAVTNIEEDVPSGRVLRLWRVSDPDWPTEAAFRSRHHR